MRLIEVFRSSRVRRVAATTAVLCLTVLTLAGFFYWQTIGYLTKQMDDTLLADARSFANESPPALRARLDHALTTDRREGKAYAIFSKDGVRLAGNISTGPVDLPSPDHPVSSRVVLIEDGQPDRSVAVRLVTEKLGDGSALIIGRTTDVLEEITEIISRAMVLAIVPALGLSLIGAVVVSRATSRRVAAVHEACQSIVAGRFDERLPVHARPDEFDRLSVIVNTMLDEIERLVTEVKGAGDAIAHDLRTPLTRLRARLERNLKAGTEDPSLKLALQKSLIDVDQLLTTVAALMRIAEVEQSRRQENFSMVDLKDLVAALTEFYEPIADEKGLRFEVATTPVAPILGDGDLLFEALANLVDNAIKFTPEGGEVGIEVAANSRGPFVAVWDTGPGIPAEERDNVLRRFYRLDRSRHQPGSGLGLSLVAAIARLHQFSLRLETQSRGGLRVELHCGASALFRSPSQSRAVEPSPASTLKNA